jgi:hypothetical protein
MLIHARVQISYAHALNTTITLTSAGERLVAVARINRTVLATAPERPHRGMPMGPVLCRRQIAAINSCPGLDADGITPSSYAFVEAALMR